MSCPTCDDGNNTFYFGYINSYYQDACEALCLAESRCYIYTYYSTSYYTDYTWRGQCVGASYDTNIAYYEYYVYSGVREESIIGNLKDYYLYFCHDICVHLSCNLQKFYVNFSFI